MPFSKLGLSPEIVRALAERGYTEPTPIQAQAIPVVLSGADLMAGAQTGTGKTAGFVLPILHRLANRVTKGPSQGRPPIRALILTPTRELAAQVEESVRRYGKHLKLTSVAVYGGMSMNNQIRQLRSRVDILVATPGRLLDHIEQKNIDLSQIEVLVLDEADRMLDMGFIPDVKRIIALMPKERQNLMFSATFSDEIKLLAKGFLKNPTIIQTEKRQGTELITQKMYRVDREAKRGLLGHLIKEHNWHQVLVFTRTKHAANRVSEHLEKDGIPALAIHGDKSQRQRMQALAKFKNNSIQVLVATDIAARGIDIHDLPHVVNYELPNVAEDYVHRIGRTGRAGNNGEAISLVCVDEVGLLKDIERLIKRSIPQEFAAGFEHDPKAKPQPINNGRSSRSAAPNRSQPRNSQSRNSEPRSDTNSRSRREGAPSTTRSAKPASPWAYGNRGTGGNGGSRGAAAARRPSGRAH